MINAIALLVLSLLFAAALIVSILTMLGCALLDAMERAWRRLARFKRGMLS
jgi:hypothetical protein